jgi:hypothetical protein
MIGGRCLLKNRHLPGITRRIGIGDIVVGYLQGAGFGEQGLYGS